MKQNGAEIDSIYLWPLDFQWEKEIQLRKSIVFSTNIERTVGYSYDKMDFNLHLRLIKLSKKRFIDLNVKN